MKFEPVNDLVHYENYGRFEEFVRTGQMTIHSDDINMSTWDEYFLGLMNVLRDGIEQPIIVNNRIKVVFDGTDLFCNMYIPTLFFNLVMWYANVSVGDRIRPYHVIHEPAGIHNTHIKNFIDRFIILKYRKSISNRLMNNIIDDSLFNLFPLNEFYGFFADTLNLKDTIELMQACPEYYECLHHDFTGVPIEQLNEEGMKITHKAMEIEMNSKKYIGKDHCLANSHRSGEGVNPKQYKEVFVVIGPKPDGNGHVYPHAITTSYVNGGVSDIYDFAIDASVARTAQILSHHNVGTSGHFARLLGLNNSNSFLNPSLDHCNSLTQIPIELKSQSHFKMYWYRYYREVEGGVAKLLQPHDTHLIGKTIYVYSPMTCNSHSHEKGVCHRCYGDMAYTNMDINIGKIAAEILSQLLTQRLLSAKHILEASIRKINWTGDFDKFFDISYDSIGLKEELEYDLSQIFLVIDPEDIYIEDEDDYDEESAVDNGKEYITHFRIVAYKNEKVVEDILIAGEDENNLYISANLNKVIRKSAVSMDEENIYVPFENLEEIPLFYVKLMNNELSKVLEHLKNMINKKPVTEKFNLTTLLQEFIDTIVEGGLSKDIDGIHCEVILSNQIHHPEGPFKYIDWFGTDVKYQIVTLNDALMRHRSPTITLMYQKLAKVLATPLTYEKHGPSFIDLFFMEQPQRFLNSDFAESQYDSEVPEKAPYYINLSQEEYEDSVSRNEEKKLIPAPYYIKD